MGEPADLAEVAAIQAASPEAASWEVAEYLRHDFRVAVQDGRMQGFLVARTVAPGECEVLNMAVAPEFRRRGIGRALFESLLGGYRGAVFLEVRESNEIARKFYKIIGFQEVGRRPDYYGSPPETAIVMKFHSC
jgi:ribosomal-protein-alanine N-acetyltransferase